MRMDIVTHRDFCSAFSLEISCFRLFSIVLMVRSCNGCTMFGDLYLYHFVAITCFLHSHFRSLLDSFLCRQDINIVDNVLRSLRSLLKLKFLGYCNASGLMHCLCRKYIQSCFGKFLLLCFNSCCACLLTSGFSFALVGKSRTISRITIQKCTGKFQCTGGSTVLALHFDRLLSFSILIW